MQARIVIRDSEMRNRPDYYRVLKVQPDAPVEVIRASYRTLMRELRMHPDLGGSTETAALLNEAYEVLSDKGRRAEYDRLHSAQLSRQSAAASIEVKPPTCPFCGQTLRRRARPGDCCPGCESPVQSREIAQLEDASRRSVARMRRDDRILYRTAWPQKAKAGRLVDLSPRGMRFICSEMIMQDSVIKVSAASFEALATVTNSHLEPDDGKELYSVGASFVAVNFGISKGTFLSAQA